MSACLHRYFAHRGFTCSRFVQFLLYLGDSVHPKEALNGGPRCTEGTTRPATRPTTLHSPVVKGFLMAVDFESTKPGNEGALGAGTDFRWYDDLLAFPELAIMENLHFGVVLAAHYDDAAVRRYPRGPLLRECVVGRSSASSPRLLQRRVPQPGPRGLMQVPGACQARDIPLDPLSKS